MGERSAADLYENSYNVAFASISKTYAEQWQVNGRSSAVIHPSRL